MKYCNNCGTKLESDNYICPNCGIKIKDNKNNNKKKGLPTWAIILIVLGCIIVIPIILLIAVAVIGYHYIKDNGEEVINHFENEIEERIDINNESIIVSEKEINETVYMDDIDITLINYKEYDEITNDIYTLNKQDGYKYLVLLFNVKNKDDDDNLFITEFNFTGTLKDEIISNELYLGKIDKYSSLNTIIKPYEDKSGFIIFKVKDNWNNFTIEYNSYEEEIAKFTINKEMEKTENE